MTNKFKNICRCGWPIKPGASECAKCGGGSGYGRDPHFEEFAQAALTEEVINGAIECLINTVAILDGSKGNPEDNSRMIWNDPFDEMRAELAETLDALRLLKGVVGS